ncbi:MAG: MFS transporter [Candidatus Dojkabacteria bacterium]|nr:MFS transporter [Candidatus Dojkabacteria bacterium]
MFNWGAIDVINSLVGIFIAEKFGDSAIEYVGIGFAIINITKASLQIPIGLLVDKIAGNKDEIVFLIFGSIFIGIPFLLYPLITTKYQFFILQACIGVGMSLNLISWRKLFALNLDKGNEGIEYGVYDTIYSISVALLSFIAGMVAGINNTFFNTTVVTFGIIVILSSLWAILIAKELKKHSINHKL